MNKQELLKKLENNMFLQANKNNSEEYNQKLAKEFRELYKELTKIMNFWELNEKIDNLKKLYWM